MTGKTPSSAGRSHSNHPWHHELTSQPARPPPKITPQAARPEAKNFFSPISVAWMEPICRALIQEQELRRQAFTNQ